MCTRRCDDGGSGSGGGNGGESNAVGWVDLLVSVCRDVLRVPWRTVWRTWRRSARADGVSFRVRMFALVCTGLDKLYVFFSWYLPLYSA